MAGRLSRWPRRIALASHLLLLAGLPATAGLPGALLALPLLAPLPGLLRARPYTHAWCSLLIVFYVGGALAEAWAHPQRAVAAFALALLAAVEFVALLLFVRFTAVERRRAAEPVPQDPTSRS